MQSESRILLPDDHGELSDPSVAWAAYEPDAGRPWNLARAGHLLRRAGFGASWDELSRALREGPSRTIDRLVRPEADVAAFNALHDRYEESATDSAPGKALRAWWLRRMIETPHPLLEKMTLFWHDHFSVQGARVKDARLLRRHVGMLRRHALGSLEAMFEDASLDPAVLVSLGASANRKSRPGEHLAHTFLDLYTVGPDHASQEDVRGFARAFTGWFVRRDEIRFVPREHDPGVKQLLGERGKLAARDAVRIAVRHPATSRWLVGKLYRWLISETTEPPATLLDPLVDSFSSHRDVGRLVETMLRSNLFFSPIAHRQRVKAPVEFALGIVRGLEGIVGTVRLGEDLASLGQDLYSPPTVHGWAGGLHWIHGFTIVGRSNLALDLLMGAGAHGDRLDPLAVARKYGHATSTGAGRFLVDLLLQGDLESGVGEILEEAAADPAETWRDEPARRLRRVAHLIVTLPEFQLA